MMNRVRGFLGYRGACLIMFGILYVCMGFGVALNEAAIKYPTVFHTMLPTPLRVTVWEVCGAVAIVAAFRVRLQWIGFTALVLPPLVRAVSYLRSIVIEAVTLPAFPWNRVQGVALYLIVVATVIMIAAWPEPTKIGEGEDDA